MQHDGKDPNSGVAHVTNMTEYAAKVRFDNHKTVFEEGNDRTCILGVLVFCTESVADITVKTNTHLDTSNT